MVFDKKTCCCTYLYNSAYILPTDSDNLHEDLAELACEINIKQKLIEDLERTTKNMQSMKAHYEDKVMQLQIKIKETEVERDTVLANMGEALLIDEHVLNINWIFLLCVSPYDCTLAFTNFQPVSLDVRKRGK